MLDNYFMLECHTPNERDNIIAKNIDLHIAILGNDLMYSTTNSVYFFKAI